MRFFHFLLCIPLLAMTDCIQNKNFNAEISNRLGTKIIFEQNIDENVLSTDSIFPYTIVYYMDSTVCFWCRLSGWNKFIKELEDSTSIQVPTIMLVSSGCGIEQNLLTKMDKPNQRFYIDEDEKFIQKNHLHNSEILKCMLLNEKKEIIIIGNPLINSHVKTLFFKRIKNRVKSMRTELKQQI